MRSRKYSVSMLIRLNNCHGCCQNNVNKLNFTLDFVLINFLFGRTRDFGSS